MDEIHRALAENQVIFSATSTTRQNSISLPADKFGELPNSIPPRRNEGDDPALMKIYADRMSPRANGEGWHTDVSCDLEPPMGSILYISSARRAAATRCSPTCMRPMKRCRIA
jgi:taurine dioxygenase